MAGLGSFLLEDGHDRVGEGGDDEEEAGEQQQEVERVAGLGLGHVKGP